MRKLYCTRCECNADEDMFHPELKHENGEDGVCIICFHTHLGTVIATFGDSLSLDYILLLMTQGIIKVALMILSNQKEILRELKEIRNA